jgi:hypothetical protein
MLDCALRDRRESGASGDDFLASGGQGVFSDRTAGSLQRRQLLYPSKKSPVFV